MKNENAAKYGKYFWQVECSKKDLTFNADRVRVSDNGDLIAERELENGEWQSLLSLASGEWKKFWAASCIDGSPVCVDNEYPHKS